MLIECIKTLLIKDGYSEKDANNFILNLNTMLSNPNSYKNDIACCVDEDFKGIISKAKYSRDDVTLLMKRRVERTHKAFFDRYHVKDLVELDYLVNISYKLLDKYKDSDEDATICEYGTSSIYNK